eukprot:TRINITY_DN1157_c0_g1_i1.p1 TRINITY_DN1157_c0_g1~~TRINITY_DN1157_c0_g1_i1.p1  ORF type:complete len:147 (-),score=27.90 TRINITY_DN1157_c0_g1_i1:19-459(-)
MNSRQNNLPELQLRVSTSNDSTANGQGLGVPASKRAEDENRLFSAAASKKLGRRSVAGIDRDRKDDDISKIQRLLDNDDEKGVKTAQALEMLNSYIELDESDPRLYELRARAYTCLLYTSDAADDLLCVDLGGRRIIKKKNINTLL